MPSENQPHVFLVLLQIAGIMFSIILLIILILVFIERYTRQPNTTDATPADPNTRTQQHPRIPTPRLRSSQPSAADTTPEALEILLVSFQRLVEAEIEDERRTLEARRRRLAIPTQHYLSVSAQDSRMAPSSGSDEAGLRRQVGNGPVDFVPPPYELGEGSWRREVPPPPEYEELEDERIPPHIPPNSRFFTLRVRPLR